jgi:preprotein translocase subunit YajC
MFRLKPPLDFETYQDVKNNLMYWTLVLLLVSITVTYFIILNQPQQKAVSDFITSLATNAFAALISGILFIILYLVVAIGLIFGIQIHDVVYDKLIIKWREKYDVEFILARLTEPIKEDLPKNFSDFANRYRYDFMKPFYDFVGDGKPGIHQNTRIRFYERVTWYWVTQLNEIFILLFLVGTPLYVLAYPSNSMSTSGLAAFVLVLTALGLVNRWLVRLTRTATTQATVDEIEEILSKPENIDHLKNRYKQLCDSHRL